MTGRNRDLFGQRGRGEDAVRDMKARLEAGWTIEMLWERFHNPEGFTYVASPQYLTGGTMGYTSYTDTPTKGHTAMELMINTADPLSDADRAILDILLGNEAAPEAARAKPAAKKTAAPAKPDPEEDLLGGEDPTLADAMSAATKLVADGQAAKVKEALAAAGSKKVSELSKPEDIATFLSALGG